MKRTFLILTFLILGTSFLKSAQWELLVKDSSGKRISFIASFNRTMQLYSVDGGGVYISYDSGSNWKKTAYIITQLSTVKKIAVNSSGQIAIATSWDGLCISLDSGSTWQRTLKQYKDVITTAWVGNELYAGTYAGVFSSTDHGATWTQEKSGIATTKIIALESSVSGDLVAVADDGRFFIHYSYATSWVEITPGKMLTNLSGIGFDAKNNIIAVDWDLGIYHSTNKGFVWEKTESDAFANVSLTGGIAGNQDGIIAMGTYADGIVFSSDDGKNWQKLTIDGQANSQISSIHVDKRGRIYAGTATGSIYTFTPQKPDFVEDLFSATELPVSAYLNGNELSIFLPRETGTMDVSIFDYSGREISNYSIQNAEQEVSLPFTDYIPGVYLLRINIGDKAKVFKLIKP